MTHYLTISTNNIKEIIESLDSLKLPLVNIEEYACEDFRSTKRILDVLKDLDIEHVLSDVAKAKLSAIVSDLQYVDVLQQRLSHVIKTNNILRAELIVFPKNSNNSIIAYRALIKLNLKQFQNAIDLYLHTTDAVYNSLTEISKNHKMLFLHIPETRLLYKNNTRILLEATAVCEIHERELLKYQHPTNLLFKDCIHQIKDIASFYTMEQERMVLDSFLKEMGHDQGYDLNSDKEQISLF